MSCVTSSDVIIKTSEEVLNVSMNFSDILGDSETISTETVISSPDDLTITGVASSGGSVIFTIAGGVVNTTYIVEVKITTSDSQTIVGYGTLKVRDR